VNFDRAQCVVDWGSVALDQIAPRGAGDDTEILRLDNQLCFALYAASRAVIRTYRDKLSAAGLTYPQYLVLLVLWERDDATVSEIGRRLMLDSGTLTPLLKRLEALGIVERRRGDRDEREVHVRLTAKGHALQDAAVDARLTVACRLHMSEEQIRALRGELIAMMAGISLDDEAANACDAGAVN
jgi:DNA-binding MarR family transcriptional regulator